jgi:two-component system sensor histidine kinase RegB
MVLSNQGNVDGTLVATFIVYHLMVLGFWLVMRSLGSYLEKQSERQSQAQIALEKQDRLRSIGALAAGFSHEFASPLNVAKIRLERLKRQLGESEDAVEALQAILVCENVIHQMNSSQMDSRDFQFKTLIVSDLLRDVIESWEEDKPQVRLSLSIQEGLETSLPPVNFSQVVINLLDNAYEANPVGTIAVRLQRQEDEILLSFEDEGPGFHSSVLRQRGEPFVTTKKNGTGLGLYVSELFAQSLAGRLEVRNKSTKGAVVSMSWPIKEDRP